MTDIPRYRCIKSVRALEIDHAAEEPIGMVIHFTQPQFNDPQFGPWIAKPDMFTRYTPVKGDFLVIYDDGYESISPRKAFLEGYVLEAEHVGAVTKIVEENEILRRQRDGLDAANADRLCDALSQEPPASHAPGLRDDVIEKCAVAAELAWTASPAEIAEIIRALKGEP